MGHIQNVYLPVYIHSLNILTLNHVKQYTDTKIVLPTKTTTRTTKMQRQDGTTQGQIQENSLQHRLHNKQNDREWLVVSHSVTYGRSMPVNRPGPESGSKPGVRHSSWWRLQIAVHSSLTSCEHRHCAARHRRSLRENKET